MISITPTITIDENEIQEEFILASGPGGQNVNKVATAVQLRFDARRSSSLSEEVRERLIQLAGRKATKEGVLIINARRFRTQERNRQDALERLIQLIRQAAERPKIRRRTNRTMASKLHRLDNKRRRGKIKRLRQSVSHVEE